jgi:hypothetical protein
MAKMNWARARMRARIGLQMSDAALIAMADRTLACAAADQALAREGRYRAKRIKAREDWRKSLRKDEKIAYLRGMLMRVKRPDLVERIEARLAELLDPWSLD